MLSANAVPARAAQLDENTPSGNATITTVVPESHKITVTVTGNADVTLDGKTGTEFELERLSEPTLTIKAKDGDKIVQVTLNGKDITDKLTDGKYKLPPVFENESLNIQVKTETLPASSKAESSSSKADSSSKATNTGSVANPNTGVVGGASICSGLVIAALIMTKRRSKDSEE